MRSHYWEPTPPLPTVFSWACPRLRSWNRHDRCHRSGTTPPEFCPLGLYIYPISIINKDLVQSFVIVSRYLSRFHSKQRMRGRHACIYVLDREVRFSHGVGEQPSSWLYTYCTCLFIFSYEIASSYTLACGVVSTLEFLEGGFGNSARPARYRDRV
jgi:hypothetical protein